MEIGFQRNSGRGRHSGYLRELDEKQRGDAGIAALGKLFCCNRHRWCASMPLSDVHIDPSRLGFCGFGQSQRQHAVSQLRGYFLLIDFLVQLELPEEIH